MVKDQFRHEIERGEALFQNGKIEEALKVFEAVLEKEPDNINALNDKGVALNNLQRYEEAIQTFLEILRKENRNSKAVFNLISNCLAVGKYDEAENIFKQYGHCLAEQDNEMIRNDIEEFKSVKGKIPHAEMARGPIRFDYEKMQERVNKTLRNDLFFIMGVPKSGTTWAQYLLDAHPEICCSGEADLNQLMDLSYQLVNEYNNRVTEKNKHIGTTNYAVFDTEDLQYILLTAASLLVSNAGGCSTVKCVGLKNPPLTKTVRVYAPLLSNANFIHIIRDGRDVIVSAWFNNLRKDEKGTIRRWPDFRDFVEFGVQEWVSEIEKVRSFGQDYPKRYFELQYEDLHRDPDAVIRQTLKFLGVDSSESMVDQCRQAGKFERLSKGRQRGQEDRNAFFRKGIIGDWKNHFDQECSEIFMRHGGDLLRELGYE